ncbi:uncharacterized protein [Phaenicophaeus curvirostris]|uniref:uncharacterized protein isoform X2 n=1 Tax=Phaenicophaeus curvirostris TaxID=33595 RepID=UPI0037F0AB1E
MGFERAKDNTKARKSSQLPSDLLKEILEELEKAEPGTDGGTVDEEALWEGGVRAAPISDEETGPIQSTGAPGEDGDKNSKTVALKGFWSYCSEGIAAVLGCMLLGMVFCCVCRLWRKRRRNRSRAS